MTFVSSLLHELKQLVDKRSIGRDALHHSGDFPNETCDGVVGDDAVGTALGHRTPPKVGGGSKEGGERSGSSAGNCRIVYRD